MSATNGDALTVQIDPKAVLPNRYLGSDEDGPQYGPVSLYDAIVERAAEMLVKQIEKDAKREIVEQVTDAARTLIDEKLPAIVEDALTGKLEVTDQWGHTTSKGTLREIMVKHAQEQLTLKDRNGYGRDTVMTEVVRKEIDYSLSGELSGAVQKAKATILKKVEDQAASALAKAVVDGVTRR